MIQGAAFARPTAIQRPVETITIAASQTPAGTATALVRTAVTVRPFLSSVSSDAHTSPASRASRASSAGSS